MQNKAYTDEKNALVVLALLKSHGIRKVVASPGTTNMALVGSMQNDAYFEMYSAVDERSAAYMACGLAAESGEPVVISCTGATASRNYLPGLTEAYYRKLPVLAITSTQAISRVGHHIAQVIDRSSKPIDAVKLSVTLPIVKDDEDLWDCEMKVNRAILELQRHGGGPVHINLPTTYNKSFSVGELPTFRMIQRVTRSSDFPPLPKGRIAVFVGAHKRWTTEQTEAIDKFCAANDAVVFCDHTSNYYGKYRLLFSIVAGQKQFDHGAVKPAVMIHIGEVSGDYYGARVCGGEVWRVSDDGEIRDSFRRLRYVFEMSEELFFTFYTNDNRGGDTYLASCKAQLSHAYRNVPELPFSNIWLASKLAHRIPDGSVVHFGILNSLRSWNFFELPQTVSSSSNVGGFGIDGNLSTVIGAALVNPEKIYFCVVGDLAFFYDMNALGNRHVSKNLRILLVNNGKGVEFRHHDHPCSHFGDQADQFIAAAGHYGKKSPALVKHYAEDLGFEYFAASSKEEVEKLSERFLAPSMAEKPLLWEVFTDGEDESLALEQLMSAEENVKVKAKQLAHQILGKKSIGLLKSIVRSGTP